MGVGRVATRGGSIPFFETLPCFLFTNKSELVLVYKLAFKWVARGFKLSSSISTSAFSLTLAHSSFGRVIVGLDEIYSAVKYVVPVGASYRSLKRSLLTLNSGLKFLILLFFGSVFGYWTLYSDEKLCDLACVTFRIPMFFNCSDCKSVSLCWYWKSRFDPDLLLNLSNFDFCYPLIPFSNFKSSGWFSFNVIFALWDCGVSFKDASRLVLFFFTACLYLALPMKSKFSSSSNQREFALSISSLLTRKAFKGGALLFDFEKSPSIEI